MRALRWEPVVGCTAIAILAVLGASLVPEAAAVIAVRTGLLLTAASFAFAADDLVGAVLPASPSGPVRRLGARVGRAGPLVVGGWLLVDVAGRDLGGGTFPWYTATALAVAGLAVAVGLDRWTDLASPGAVGTCGLVLLVSVAGLLSVPHRLGDLMGSPTASAVALALAGATIALVERGRR